MRSQKLDAIGNEGSGLRVEFIQCGDRYGHVISLVEPEGNTLAVLESVEGAPADDWPPSPPLQSLHLQDLPDGRRAALLVGMAGSSHWSASIEVLPGNGELLFDLACRRGSVAGTLGSQYRCLDAAKNVELATLEDTAVNKEGSLISIRPIKLGGTGQATERWRYRIGAPAGSLPARIE